ncbi:MAG: hypothetical protein QFE16_02055 [Pseudomonadota bacterium]|nr:hypothetical protein [Pseudomonadota bacterium]
MTSVCIFSPRPLRAGLALLSLCGAFVHMSVGAVAPGDPGPLGNEDGYTVSTQDVDPPGRAGRLSEVIGQVWLYSPEDREWISAERNRPLTTGDRIATDASARAELRVGSTVVRLDSNTELEVLRLDDDHLQLQLHRGAGVVRLRDSELAAQFEMVTAEGRFRSDRAGGYRFDRVDGNTQATALSGRLYYEGSDQALTINSGQRAEFVFDANGRAQYAIVEAKRDAFAAWNAVRDRDEVDRVASQRYVSPEMTGAEELDRHGRWEQDPEYGALWIPRDVAPGWAPYSTGRWAWVQPWGWTWVDVAPWGFAPFHYGRWVHRGGAWGWAPGGYVARPVYAPALVGWVGGRPPVRRPGVDISISIGSGPGIGWFPLAPRERYVPGFRASPRYEHELNGPRGSRFDPPRGSDRHQDNDRPQDGAPHSYINRGVPNAVTTVPPQVFGSRQPGVSPTMPIPSRPDDRGGSRRPRDDSPNGGPGFATPGAPSGLPAPRPAVRPSPIPQGLPAPVLHPAPAVPSRVDPLRDDETRRQWIEAERERAAKRQAPAVPAEPPQPAVRSSPVPQGLPAPVLHPAPTAPSRVDPLRDDETRRQWIEAERERAAKRQAPAVPAEPPRAAAHRDDERNAPRGAEGSDQRRERPSVPGGDPRADGRDGRDKGDGRDPRDGRDRRNAN